MKLEAKCKICGVRLELEIDESCGQFGRDHLKLLLLATCDRCYDYRQSRLRLISGLNDRLAALELLDQKSNAEEIQKLVLVVANILERYCHAVQKHERCQTELYDPLMLDAVMSNPNKCGDVIR